MKKNTLIFILSLLLFSNSYNTAPCHARNNASNNLEYLDNPYFRYYPDKKQIYARNIWDMIGFQGKLYLGAGNSSNQGPSPNAGPVPIIAYTPETNSFDPVFMTSDEQIDAFYLHNNRLLVPGHDPKESWALGNLYLLEDGQQWQKKRTIPNAIHTYCLCFFNNKLFAGLGAANNGPSVAVSDDLGTSWNLLLPNHSERIYNFLVVTDKLYALGMILSPEFTPIIESIRGKPYTAVHEYSDKGKFFPRQDINSNQLFPETLLNPKKRYKISNPQTVNDKAIYMGSYIHNDHQFIPFGLYVAESLTAKALSIKKIPLPEGALPWDIYHSGKYIYILLNKTIIDDMVEVSVLRSDNLKDWTELFYFVSPALVRSFALLENNFYFSIGSEITNSRFWNQNELKPETGDILKLDGRHFLQDQPQGTI
ncbi:MAG: hypothetical protein KKH60_09650 [Proteobacteria bacterium]|nr:hypothetical protein [Pseudomonadota bacterium]